MTREEAKTILGDYEYILFEDEDTYNREAFRMAISALSQEPCDDAEQIGYHDDFATALKKINDYEMTRDERTAISILNAYKEGYESAIEDYKQEPCEDAISRDAVLIIAGMHTLTVDETIKAIEGLPSVTQKSGVWDASCTCSVCGEWRILESEKNGGKYKYCPNCGAKMESE
jgi:hypothetical protein